MSSQNLLILMYYTGIKITKVYMFLKPSKENHFPSGLVKFDCSPGMMFLQNGLIHE